MIDWWGLARNALWVMGLAVGLAAVSVAGYEAQSGGQRFRTKLAEPSFQLAVNVALALFGAGLLFSARAWWERVVWGVLAALFAVQVAWPWWQARGKRRAAAAAAAPERPRLSRRARTAGCALVLGGVLVVAGAVVVMGRQALDHAHSLQAHLQALEAVVGGGVADLDAGLVKDAGAHLAGMHEDLAALEKLAAPFLPLCRYLGWVPTHGGDVAAAPDLVDVAVGTTAAGDRVFVALAPAVDLLTGANGELALSLEASAQALPVMAAARPELQEAQAELSAVRQARQRIDAQRLSPRVAGLMGRLDHYLPWFETAVDGALAAPALLGADGPRTYLVVAQNNHELRATGGFISGVGELRVEGGRIASLNFVDSYDVDNFQVPHDVAPPDMHAVLWGEIVLFRDANWDPDFPTSARRMIEIYARDRGVEADGVIAMDLATLKLLVDATGPVEVDGIEAPVTGKNVLQIVQEQWGREQDDAWREWWEHRKDFMGDIAAAVLQRVRTGDGLQPAKLARAVQTALDEKHLLVYVDDLEAAELLRRHRWDGAVEPDFTAGLTGDSLMVVDTNAGFNKVDPNVARAIHYRVDLGAADGPRAELGLTYDNKSARPADACVQEARYGDTYADMTQRCYWDYVRVYVPWNSKMVSGPDLPLPPGSLLARLGDPAIVPPPAPALEETWHEVWTTFFALAPLDSTKLAFEYRLPFSVVEYERDGQRRYTLHVQKQPGTDAVPFELTVILPESAEIVSITPAGLQPSQGANGASISTTLRTDQWFEIIYTEESVEP